MTNGSKYDLLGEMMLAALHFAMTGFSSGFSWFSSVINKQVMAEDSFVEREGRWFMQDGVLPGDIAIMALAIDRDAMYLETAPLNISKVRELIRAKMLPLAWDVRRKSIVDSSTRRVVGRIAAPTDLELELPKELGERVLWTLPYADLDVVRRQAVIHFADAVYTAAAFNLPEEEEEVVSTGQPTQTLRLQLGFQQRLQLEQRPMLTLSVQTRNTTITENRLEMQQLFSLQHSILRMSPSELTAFANQDLSPEGQAKTLRIFLFVLAGQVKRALTPSKPDITWREARQIAHRMVEKGAQPNKSS
jgi:hypothetical protein